MSRHCGQIPPTNARLPHTMWAGCIGGCFGLHVWNLSRPVWVSFIERFGKFSLSFNVAGGPVVTAGLFLLWGCSWP